MHAHTYQTVEPILDEIAEIADKQFESPELRKLLTRISEALGERYTASVNVIVDVFDGQEERTLPLMNTGLSAIGGKEPHRLLQIRETISHGNLYPHALFQH